METIDDIVREMRNKADLLSIVGAEDYLNEFADRIEKAHEFWSAVDKSRAAGECYDAGKQSATSKESLPVGNAAKMREALEHCIEELSPYCNGGARRDEVLAEAKAAFDFPARNCDVGMAEEQEERYIKLKLEHIDKLARCPAVGPSFFPDSLYWAQMPYEEAKEGGAE